MQISKERIFIILNVAVFSIVPLLTYKRPENMMWWHFLLAFSVIFLISWFLWKQAENFQLSTRSLLLIQLGLILHYLGTIHFLGTRGYNIILMGGIRFDKLVHFINSFIGIIVLTEWSEKYNSMQGKGKKFWMILIVLGLGAIIEIIEYLGALSIESIDLQDPYNNNMQDLIANLLGTITASLF